MSIGAVAERRDSPFCCGQNPLSGYRISEIMGIKAPGNNYGFQPGFFSRSGISFSPEALRKEVVTKFKTVDDILVKIEHQKARRR